MIFKESKADIPKLLLSISGVIILMAGVIASYYAIPAMVDIKDHFQNIWDPIN